jgi:hypothetical protein
MPSPADGRAEPRPALRKRAPSHPLEPPGSEPRPAADAPPDPLVPFGTRVPRSLRQRLRILAVTTGTTEQALTIQALKLLLERSQAEGGP